MVQPCFTEGRVDQIKNNCGRQYLNNFLFGNWLTVLSVVETRGHLSLRVRNHGRIH